MPPKPRPQGKPKTPKPPGSSQRLDRRLLAVLALVGIVVVALLAVGLAAGLGGSDEEGEDAIAALEAIGCTVTSTPALLGQHTVTTPEGTSDAWNTDPPTSGPHYEVPAIWGSYDEPVNQAQLVHNLEHGGIAIQYGEDVPAATVAELEGFVQEHPRGTVLAPHPSLGNRIALGVWVTESASEPENGTAHLAKCESFDEAAFASFFDAYQFQGPERFPPDTLLPGRQ